MPETSFMGISFTPTQQKTLDDDIALIDKISNDISGQDWTYNRLEGEWTQVKSNIDNADNYCGKMNPARSRCLTTLNSQWDEIRGKQAASSDYKAVLISQLEAAKNNYNFDLDAIQNAIKFGIQAQQSNSNVGTQSAQNQVTINQNDPRLLLKKAEADAAQKLKSIELQATLDKQKREQQVNLVGFVLIAIVIAGIGWYLLRKIL